MLNRFPKYRFSPVCLSLILGFLALFLISCEDKQKSSPQSVDSTNEDISTDKTPEISNEATGSNKKFILFFGNSLTAGYGLEEDESFVSLIQERIDSLGFPYTVINAGLSGETTAGGNGRINWVLKQDIDIFVLELGGNDVLRGLALDDTKINLREIIEKVRAKNPDIPVILAGMQAPPNLGDEYTRTFSSIFPELAEQYDAGLIPFLLEGVAGNPKLNLPDGIHPNAEGQKIVRENVWQVLEGYLRHSPVDHTENTMDHTIRYTYADGSGNVYILNSEYLEYRPVKPEDSSSGTYSGGEPKKVAISVEDWKKAVPVFLVAIENEHEHTNRREMGTGMLRVTYPDGTRRHLLRRGSVGQTGIEKLLKEFLGK